MSCWVETWTLSIFPAVGKIAEAISFDGIFYSLFVSVGIMKFANTKSMEKVYLWVHITQEQNQLRGPNFDAVVTTMCRTNCSVFNTGLQTTLKLQICYTYEYGPIRLRSLYYLWYYLQCWMRGFKLWLPPPQNPGSAPVKLCIWANESSLNGLVAQERFHGCSSDA